MAQQKPIFNDVIFWLNKKCILPYTAEELDSLGCLGFDMKKYPEFGKKYMEKLIDVIRPVMPLYIPGGEQALEITLEVMGND